MPTICFSSGTVVIETIDSNLRYPTVLRRASLSTIMISKSDRAKRKKIVNSGGNKNPTSAPRKDAEPLRSRDVFLSESKPK